MKKLDDAVKFARKSKEWRAEYMLTHQDKLVMQHKYEALLAEKDTVLAEKDEALAAKDTVLAEKDEALAAKDTVLAEKDKALAAKDAEIAKLKALLENKE